MEKTPKSMRLQIAIVGNTNVGKSTLFNAIAGQDISITSPQEGTTTDTVEKAMELLPLGPVLFLDTAGAGDRTSLGEKRMQKASKIYGRADVAILVVDSKHTEEEDRIRDIAQKEGIPLLTVITKIDKTPPSEARIKDLQKRGPLLSLSPLTTSRDKLLTDIRDALIPICDSANKHEIQLLGDLVEKNAHIVFIVPIDKQAPKGRLILPQVQAIRDALDNNILTSVVTEREYLPLLNRLKTPPELVVCDSQVVDFMVSNTPKESEMTTFSTLFARFKGDLEIFLEGAITIDKLADGDSILIAEACTHHDTEDDIGRVKIPRWLEERGFKDLNIDIVAGRDFPDNLSKYSLIIHCGSCMFTPKEMSSRIKKAGEAGVPITNYGLAIASLKGVLKEVLKPFKREYNLFYLDK